MKRISRKLTDFVNNTIAKHKLAIALTLSIIITLLMTVTSVYIYVRSGVSQLDLSRPGYESIRKQVETGDPRRTFDDEGPIDQKTVDEFLKLLHDQTTELQNVSDFSGSSLDDTALDIAP